MITLSNMHAAMLILTGINSGGKYTGSLENLMKLTEKILQADNDLVDGQQSPTVMTTSGIRGEF